LDEQSAKWEGNCGLLAHERPTGKCERVLENTLKPQWKKFVSLASEYRPSGSDCQSGLRGRWMTLRIHQFNLNLKFAGTSGTSWQTSQFALNQERSALMADIRKCAGQ